ncbi:MAG: SRPBCC family protein [Candidatus Anammoxibacter sp.]
MACVEAKLNAKAPVDRVWEVISNYGDVHLYHPMVKSAPILSANDKGVGAKRRCEFYDKSSLVEEVTNWDEGRSISFVLSEMSSMPLKKANATIKVEPVDSKTSLVSINMNFVVKWGPLGWMMGKLMMKPMMKKMFTNVLKGLEYYAVTGKAVENMVPEMQTV